ncbi:MAG: glycosyltransferase [Verrucomicrobiota bacterium]|nr:glycosyltransferase [Verrucomicrobiota bacterium]
MNSSSLSIIIPSFNGAVFLASLLPKVRSALPAAEIIVVDDGSIDTTAAVTKSSADAIIYLQQPRCGPSAARNYGLQKASSPMIAFLDIDDEWTGAHPTRAMAKIQQNDWEIVLGRTQCFIKGADETFAAYAEPFHTFLLGSAVMRRDIFERIGGFDESLGYGEDLDWFLRAREAGVRMALLDETVLHYRLHQQNLIVNPGAATRGMLHALHLSIARRKNSSDVFCDLPLLS